MGVYMPVPTKISRANFLSVLARFTTFLTAVFNSFNSLFVKILFLHLMVGMGGIEPPFYPSEGHSLPLTYIPFFCWNTDFVFGIIGRSFMINICLLLSSKMAGVAGLEPATIRLTVGRSTN